MDTELKTINELRIATEATRTVAAALLLTSGILGLVASIKKHKASASSDI